MRVQHHCPLCSSISSRSQALENSPHHHHHPSVCWQQPRGDAVLIQRTTPDISAGEGDSQVHIIPESVVYHDRPRAISVQRSHRLDTAPAGLVRDAGIFTTVVVAPG